MKELRGAGGRGTTEGSGSREQVAGAAREAGNSTGAEDAGAAGDAQKEGNVSGAMGRREALGVISLMPLAALDWGSGPAVKERAAHAALAAPSAIVEGPQAGAPYAPAFFTSHEWETVRILVDLIIPRDERSGSATDAGVPEFMDFMMTDRPKYQTPIRGGLAWLDAECGRRFSKSFVASTSAETSAESLIIATKSLQRPDSRSKPSRPTTCASPRAHRCRRA